MNKLPQNISIKKTCKETLLKRWWLIAVKSFEIPTRPFSFENIMNNSVGSAIEKIKLQEQDNEVKLKERRECK